MVVARRQVSEESDPPDIGEHSKIENESIVGAVESTKREISAELEIFPAASWEKNFIVLVPWFKVKASDQTPPESAVVVELLKSFEIMLCASAVPEKTIAGDVNI